MQLSRLVLKADTPTLNGNIYPKSVLESIVKKEKHKVKAGLSLGTFGMPELDDVSLSEASHRVIDLKLIDNELRCDVEILNTPVGKKVQELLTNGEELTVRPAGFGRVNNGVVQPDYSLISLNIVKQSDAS